MISIPFVAGQVSESLCGIAFSTLEIRSCRICDINRLGMSRTIRTGAIAIMIFKSIIFAIAMYFAIGGSSLMLIAADAQQVFVALTGDDLNDGSSKFPVRSVDRAQAIVRHMILDGLKDDVEVRFAEGVYQLNRTLEFGPEDSPPRKLRVVYQAALGAKVVFSGGSQLRNWKKNNNGFWETSWRDQINELTTESSVGPLFVPRQMFIDAKRGIRARDPDSGYFRVRQAIGDFRTEFRFNSDQWTYSGPTLGMELALLHDWSISRVRVKEIDLKNSTVKLTERIGGPHDFFRINGFEQDPRFFFENSVSFLNAPDEFIFTREQKTVQVVLTADENPNQMEITVPRLATLVRVAGSKPEPVRGIQFSGICFSYSSCPLPPGGYGGIQASYFENRLVPTHLQELDTETESGHLRLPAAIEFSFAEECGFEESTFRHLGGGAIYLARQTNDCFVKSSQIEDVGGCGVMVGETVTRKDRQGRSLVCHGNSIEGNQISRCGQILLGSVGVWVGIAKQTQVNRNEIFNLPYSGVSVGWQWNDQPSGCEQNSVCNNRIHDIMLELSDGGGIYTLGRQPGTVLAGNRIYDIPSNHGRAESNGIFMDQGSSEILVQGNVITGAKCSPMRFHLTGKNTLKENQCFHPSGVEPLKFNNTPKENIKIIDNLFQVEGLSEASPSNGQ